MLPGNRDRRRLPMNIYLYLRRKKKHRSILKQINQLATEELTYSRSTDDVAYTYNFCLFVCFGDDL